VPIPIDFSKLSPQDILDIAAFIEEEARERYETFAAHMEAAGDLGAARFFLKMAELEGSHGAQVTARRQTRFSDLPSHVRNAVEWDVEGPPLDRSRRSFTVAEALDLAVASEVRARDFFAEAAEHLVDPAVAAVLRELHGDEVQHIKMLAERRAALPTAAR
jgi:rubrerythrin